MSRYLRYLVPLLLFLPSVAVPAPAGSESATGVLVAGFVCTAGVYNTELIAPWDVLQHSVYRDSEKENTYSVIGKWRTRPAMEKHFKAQNFGLLIGAARVLGETFEMNIGEVLKTGGYKLAKEQIAAQQKEGAAED